MACGGNWTVMKLPGPGVRSRNSLSMTVALKPVKVMSSWIRSTGRSTENRWTGVGMGSTALGSWEASAVSRCPLPPARLPRTATKETAAPPVRKRLRESPAGAPAWPTWPVTGVDGREIAVALRRDLGSGARSTGAGRVGARCGMRPKGLGRLGLRGHVWLPSWGSGDSDNGAFEPGRNRHPRGRYCSRRSSLPRATRVELASSSGRMTSAQCWRMLAGPKVRANSA